MLDDLFIANSFLPHNARNEPCVYFLINWTPFEIKENKSWEDTLVSIPNKDT